MPIGDFPHHVRDFLVGGMDSEFIERVQALEARNLGNIPVSFRWAALGSDAPFFTFRRDFGDSSEVKGLFVFYPPRVGIELEKKDMSNHIFIPIFIN